MSARDKHLVDRWNQLIEEVNVLHKLNKVIRISPYWNLWITKEGSHDDLYAESGVRILPKSILNNPEDVVESVQHSGDYIYGWNASVFSNDIRAFILELITPDWCDTKIKDDILNDDVAIVNRWRNHNFNAPKVYQIISCMRDYLYEDEKDKTFIGLSCADCFFEDMMDDWAFGQTAEQVMYDLYLAGKLKRSD